MLTYIFPGQGSQQKGMGSGLFEEFPELIKVSDEILGYSMEELCLRDPSSLLNNTKYTQPALYVVNALCFLKTIKETNIKLDFVAGHSLGEYNALLASGAFDFATGLQLVKKRAELMAEATGGGMAAILGLTEEVIAEILKNDTNGSRIDIANYNTPSQFVISGPVSDIDSLKPIFEGAGARYVILKVSGAFHSRYMAEAKRKYEEFLDGYNFSKLQIPVISNAFARQYNDKEIKTTLAEQIVKPVKWTESIRYLMGKGDMEFIQIGPGAVLTRLIKSIQKEAKPLIIDELEEMNTTDENLNNVNTIDEDLNNNTQKAAPVDIKDSGVIMAQSLGSDQFKKEYGLKYAYLAGGMCRLISSGKLVIKLAKAGMMGFLGTAFCSMEKIEEEIRYIIKNLTNGEAFGLNITYNLLTSESDERYFELIKRYNIRNIEVSSCLAITPGLVRFRLNGLHRDADGNITATNRIIVKISRLETAELFLEPPPEQIVRRLLNEGAITEIEALLSKEISMCNDLCIESGRETDIGFSLMLLPQVLKLRDKVKKEKEYTNKPGVGIAGGLGSPEMVAMAFGTGADFILTGSINQCTVEAGTSDVVKDILQEVELFDTAYVPSRDLFEIGVKAQVVKKGMLFPYRANKLFELYNQFNSVDDLDENSKKRLQEKFFKRSFDDVYKEIKRNYPQPELEKLAANPKAKMAAIFKWYFDFAINSALSGNPGFKDEYLIYCSPALGAFNAWVKGADLQSWRNRYVDEIALKLMGAAAEIINKGLIRKAV